MGGKPVHATDSRRPWRILRHNVLPAAALAAALVAAILAWLRIEHELVSRPLFLLRDARGSRGVLPDLAVVGATQTPVEKVHAVFARDAGRSVYLLPLEERRDQLRAIGWVQEVSVARLWPNRVRVRIRERTPVAFVPLPVRDQPGVTQPALIDRDGVLLDPPPRRRYPVPALTGIQAEHSQAARRERVERMLELMGELGKEGERISEIDAGDPDNLRVTLKIDDRAWRLYVGNENYLGRLRTFLKYYPEIRRRLPEANVLDLRIEDRITAVKEN